jgi:hypothetical protein
VTDTNTAESLLVLRRDRMPKGMPILAFAVLVIVALSRSPYLFVHGRFWAEEGSLHFRRMVLDPFPEDVLFIQNRTGYINSITNLATWLADQVPLRQAPLVTTWLSLAVILSLVWVALFWPSELLPTGASRLAAATLLLVGTLASHEVWVNSINLPTYLGLLTVLLLFVDVRRIGRARLGFAGAALGIASISGIYSVVLTPLYVVRAYQERTRRHVALAAILTVGACIQFVLVMKNRSSGDLADTKMKFPGWSEGLRESAGRHVLAFLINRDQAEEIVRRTRPTDNLLAMSFCALVVLVFIGAVLAYAPNRRVVWMLVAAFALTELLVLYGAHEGGGRYSVVPIGILILALVHGAATTRQPFLAFGATALCAVVLISGLAAFWTYGSTRLRCQNCPEWQDQVREWEAGRRNDLRIWPYDGDYVWRIRLPHDATADARR